MNPVEKQLRALLDERVLLLDGAMGTQIQTFSLSEADFRGDRFTAHPRPLQGCNDLLNLTRPEVISAIHRAYLDAGADIIETNTFNANAIALADYDLQSHAREINAAAARLARAACDAVAGPRFVAGVLGPTNRTASISPSVEDPGARAVTFDELVVAYAEAAEGLLDGGADCLLVETIFDTLNAKAALYAIDQVFEGRQRRWPIMISVTITDASGRTLSGQTIEAFWYAIRHAAPLTVGINCALGAEEMRPYVAWLSRIAETYTSVHPNAGLPNAFGGYDETPQDMAATMRTFAGAVNLVGGCCGTGPEHIEALAAAFKGVAPRPIPALAPHCRLSGLEGFCITPDSLFVNIGERTNISGSARFRRMIRAGDDEGALTVALSQVRAGAQIIDVNVDDGLLDSAAVMRRLLNRLAAEPDIARVPVMIDSSKWSVIAAGLRCLQGKGIINSLSLKEGEAPFLAQAREARRFGAAVIVMAFDEAGQADTLARRLTICRRAWGLLRGIGFPAEDIIFDPNVFAVGTGLEAHRRYALDFIEATRQLKAEMGALISGGVSNVSFAFRGNDAVREALHAVFLYHAIQAGMDMGIVNAGQLAIYDALPPLLRERAEDVILDRRADATERLLEVATRFSGEGRAALVDEAWREGSLAARLGHALVHGETGFIDADVAEALGVMPPLSIIEGPLMDGMNQVGDLFGAGKMFLPQVIKSARVMKRAVAQITPLLTEACQVARKAKIVLATVKGDVHDIGKNIVDVVLRCNGYEIEDLGVMVPAEVILDRAEAINADAVGLSGLITPSLDEMVRVAEEMARRGMTTPLLIGGATTSRIHTAVRIAPAALGPVIYIADASRAVGVLGRLFGEERAALLAEIAEEYEGLRRRHRDRSAALVPIEEARRARLQPQGQTPPPPWVGRKLLLDHSLSALRPWIDWGPFFRVWGLKGSYPAILEDAVMGEQARKVKADAEALLDELCTSGAIKAHGALGFYPAAQRGDDIVIYEDARRSEAAAVVHTLRQQLQKRGPSVALADYIAPAPGQDHLGVFAVTAGVGLEGRVAEAKAAGDDYRAIMLDAVADRLAEAFAEYIHSLARASEAEIRPAPGYPACPDHSEKATIFNLLDAEATLGITLTESFAMSPQASICGYVFLHPSARYFGVGRIGQDQLEDYAARKGIDVEVAAAWLRPNLATLKTTRG
ncbi:methionine synthase [Myxococcota bacterium]|nr:methionine synthase [Myxococcota bacterium]MBU1429642.1 methionine synthase [Myxococcota bacterium]MBU1896228.1 methionine synthase [Myxococcota bacterium]